MTHAVTMTWHPDHEDGLEAKWEHEPPRPEAGGQQTEDLVLVMTHD